MNVLRLQLDVDKAVSRPDLLDLAEAINGVPGIEAVNITVTLHSRLSMPPSSAQK